MVKINAFIKDISEFGIRRSKAEMQNDETHIKPTPNFNGSPVFPLRLLLQIARLIYRVRPKRNYRANDTIQCNQYGCAIDFVESVAIRRNLAEHAKNAKPHINTEFQRFV